MKTRTLVVAALLLLAACSKEEKQSPAASGGAPAVVDAWKKAGLTVGTMDTVDGAKYGGGECKAGQVSGVDTVLCTYPTAEAAKTAEAAGLEAVGEATGSAIAQGKVLLVVADRRKADPEGRTINQMTKLFRGK
jgi:hypothetical protein